MADTSPADQPETPKPAKAPTRARIATGDHLSRFVAPGYDGFADLVIDHEGVSVPVKDAAHLEQLAADYGVVLIVTPEKD